MLAGTFYSVVSFTLFERVRLRKLDRRHYTEGLTNGWERLWYARRDGENYTPYGERMLARLAGDGASGNGIALSPSNSGDSTPVRDASPPAYRAGGYSAVPSSADKEPKGSRNDSLDEAMDDRPGRASLEEAVEDPPRRVASIA